MSNLIHKSDSVHIKRPSPSIIWIYQTLEKLRNTLKYLPKNLVITSVNDSRHGEFSRHYSDEAIDLRSKNFNPGTKALFRLDLEETLNDHPEDPNKFIVIYEASSSPNEHFHIQVRKGQKFLDD